MCRAVISLLWVAINLNIRLHPNAQGKSVYWALCLYKARNLQWLNLFDNTINTVFSGFSVVTGGNVHSSFLWYCLPPLLSWRKWLCEKNPAHTKQGRAARLRGSQRSDPTSSEGQVSHIVKWGEKNLKSYLTQAFFFFLDSYFQKILRSVWGWGKARVSRSNEFMKYFIVFYDDSHSISWWFTVFHVDPLLMIHNTNMGYNFKMPHCMENYLFNSASPKPIWALKRCTVKFQIILMWSPNTIWTKWQACTFYRYFSWSFPNLNRKNWSCLVEMPSCSRK